MTPYLIALLAFAGRAIMNVEPAASEAGKPVELSFAIRNAKGAPVRFLEKVHERPMHLMVVSTDLAEFAHIHPQLDTADHYSVTHTFENGGDYHLFADYTAPGSGATVDAFDIHVTGSGRAPVPLIADKEWTKQQAGLRITLSSAETLRAGKDLLLTLNLARANDGAPVTDLQPYLGAFAHIVVISQDLREFIHAHPLEASGATTHTHVAAGPSPPEVSAYVNFPSAGLYKLWAQFQRGGEVVTVPFVVQVAKPEPAPQPKPIPADAIRIEVSSSGYTPARIEVRRGQTTKLAFLRTDGRNCGSEIVVPSLNIRAKLPIGEPVIIELNPRDPGELTFSCGMGMLRGLLVVQ